MAEETRERPKSVLVVPGNHSDRLDSRAPEIPEPVDDAWSGSQKRNRSLTLKYSRIRPSPVERQPEKEPHPDA